MSASLEIEVREIPFSRRGSWLDLSPVTDLHTVRDDVHLVTHQTGMHAVLRFVLERDGAPLAPAVTATPAVLRWAAGAAPLVEAVFERLDTIRIRGNTVDLRIADAADGLTPFSGTYLYRDPIDGSAVFTSYESGRRYRVSAIEGELEVEGGEALGAHPRAVTARGANGWEVAIEEFESARHPYTASGDFDAAVEAVDREFADYADAVAGWRTANSPAAELAAYVLWSATVAPRGFLARESVLMSKHWMDKVWSWDHCFNALALAPAWRDLAVDQYLAPFDHQDSSGALPDSVTHSEILYNFVKPPIHGWALDGIRHRSNEPLNRPGLVDIAEKLARSSRFWLDYRRVTGHALPHYQHGNDSGWDNSTTFDRDRVIEAPDLAGFLVLQFDTLARLADELGTGQGAAWRAERDTMRDALISELWTGTAFVARSAVDGRASSTSSLLNLLPIIAGEHLPAEIVDRLADRISEHLTQFGPATEPVTSPHYEDDGYWRGPIWAPSTVLIEDGLRRSGKTALADQVSSRFRALCEKSGFAENFDARSGAGLRDRAYTWTASAYLILARDAQLREREDA